jgi:hypothetical protein
MRSSRRVSFTFSKRNQKSTFPVLADQKFFHPEDPFAKGWFWHGERTWGSSKFSGWLPIAVFFGTFGSIQTNAFGWVGSGISACDRRDRPYVNIPARRSFMKLRVLGVQSLELRTNNHVLVASIGSGLSNGRSSTLGLPRMQRAQLDETASHFSGKGVPSAHKKWRNRR